MSDQEFILENKNALIGYPDTSHSSVDSLRITSLNFYLENYGYLSPSLSRGSKGTRNEHVTLKMGGHLKLRPFEFI